MTDKIDSKAQGDAIPAELDETQLDQAAGGAAYLKIGDIKGEAVAPRATPKLMESCATGRN